MAQHIAWSLNWFERSTDEEIEAAGISWEGKVRTAAEVREMTKTLRAEGYEYIPGCDNVDGKGQCLGHDDPPSL